MKKIEIIGKRKPREKHFLQEDGTFLAEMYDEDVHFLKNGQYEEIDSQLTLENGYYVNNKNDFDISFSAKVGNELMLLKKNNKYISISLNKCNAFSIVKNENSNKFYDCITYNNVLDGVDLKYEIIMSKIKESIIIKNKKSKIDELCFDINTNAELKMSEKGTILVVDGDHILFEFALPYLIDSNSLINENISYNLIKDNDSYQLFILLDKNWMNNKATYPIIIDPTITNISNENSVYDTYIFQNDTNISRGDLNYFKVGVERNNSGNDIINRALLKFDLPTLGTGSQIIKAELYLKNYPYITSQTLNEVIDIHRVTSDWTELGASWNNMNNAYDPRVEGAFNFYGWYGDDGNGNPIIMTESADITYLVQKWYTGTPNQGIMLKLSKEQYNLNIIPLFFSKNFQVTSGESPKPLLVISYRNQNGLEKYMNYETHSIGKANIYHNVYNGNMTAVFDLCSTQVGKMPSDLKLIYNTNDVVLNKNRGYGIGFKLNLNQTIKEVIIDNITYMEYEDEDGTIHYFMDEKKTVDSNGNVITINEQNTYYDEDGLDLKIIKYNDRYELLDKNNYKMIFTKYNDIGYLTEIKNANGDTISIYYDTNYSKILYIIDADGQFIDILYNNVITITSPTQSVTLSMLNSDSLSSIVYNDDTLYISTDQKHRIFMLNTDSGLCMNYEYYNESPYKLKKVIEHGDNNELGNYYETKYNFNSTTLIDSNNKAKTIVFNEHGNANSILLLKSENDITSAYGTKSTYEDVFNNIDLNKNKKLEEQIPIRYVKNLLTDTSFENDNISFVSDDYVELRIVDGLVNSGFKSLRYGCSLQSPSSIYQTISVEGNKYYTFSAYVSTDTFTTPVKLAIGYTDNNSIYHEEVSESIITADFERLDTTIFVPDNLANSEVKIKVVLEGMGRCYIDDIQLEEGEVANNYNMIENSDFSNGFNDWSLNPGVYNLNDIFSIVNVNNQNALKIKMYTHNYSSIEKTFNIKGKNGDKFTLCFWYKNTGLIGKELFSDGPKNVVSMTFYPSDTQVGGDLIENYILNSNENDWQFFICNFTADYDFDSFKLAIDQDLNGNEFLITNINLFNDVRSVKYNYDENGNIISIKSLNEKTKNYKFDNNNELMKVVDRNGKILYYENDNIVSDRIIRGITNTGISNEMEYNTFGTLKTNRIINKGVMLNTADGQYVIRLKGSNKILKLIGNNISLIDNYSVQDKWNVEKVTIDNKNYYKIYHSIINNKFLSQSDNNLIISNYLGDSSLFELILSDNGSYKLKNKQTGKYVKYSSDIFILSDLVESDSNFYYYFESVPDNIFLENNIIYNSDGKYIDKTIDTLLNEEKYVINTNNNLIKSKENSKKQKIEYTYNNKNQIESIIDGNKIVEHEYNNDNTLSKIKQNGRIYNFEYNNFKKIKKVKIGNNITLINNVYESNNGNLLSSTYGNGQTITYNYDEFVRIKNVIKSDNTYHYKYDSNGNLAKIISNEDTIKFTYDLAKRLYKYNNGNYSIKYIYNDNDNIIEKKYKYDNKEYIVNNELNDDYAITKLTAESSNFTYNYDNLGRLVNSNVNNSNLVTYGYYSNGKRISNMIKSISNCLGVYTYKYDKLGNIKEEYMNGSIINKYFYDSNGQLIKENNYELGRTFKYLYDNLGNIIYKKENKLETDEQISQVKYEYNDVNVNDRLTNYNNISITYDISGNPLTIGPNTQLTWVNGRQLSNYADLNNNISYKYNHDGSRINKIVNSVQTNYYLEENNIIIEQTGNNMLYYIYSNVDGLVAFKYNNDLYYYIKNLKDDIIGILDSNYNLVAKYTYDAWGNILSIKNANGVDVSNDSNHIANINPFRYRSYYYDKETGLYYLKSRYYNPKWGRFLNADNYISTDSGPIGYNMYSYANNNPINKKDPDGHAIAAGLVICIAVVGTLVIANSINRFKKAKKVIKENQKKKNIPDKTAEINKALKENAEKLNNKKYYNQSLNVNISNFINAVKSGGDQDLKSKPEYKKKTVIYDGMIMEDQDIGNLNYGYVGRAYGYSKELLLDGAGAYQIFEQVFKHRKGTETYKNCFTASICDDPRDTYFIEMGMMKYDQEH